MTCPAPVDEAVIRILARPIDDRLAAFTAECLKRREQLRRDLPNEPAHVVTEQARGFARLVLDRLQSAEGR